MLSTSEESLVTAIIVRSLIGAYPELRSTVVGHSATAIHLPLASYTSASGARPSGTERCTHVLPSIVHRRSSSADFTDGTPKGTAERVSLCISSRSFSSRAA